MKLILSRKGFDSSAGGVANPILPGGRLCPLPIPDRASPLAYADLRVAGESCGRVVESITGGRIAASQGAHLDPDLARASTRRAAGWRPLFGQAGAAQGHLRNQGVGPGDLFLFFGWFRRCVEGERGLRFGVGAPDLHVIFGWLQVERSLTPRQARRLPWASSHPHLHGDRGASNTLYLARRRLRIPGARLPGLPGAGLLPQVGPSLVLTAFPGAGRRSLWCLPGWFHPAGRDSVLSHHGERGRWRRHGDSVQLESARRGQEFVLDLEHYPEARPWLGRLLRMYHGRGG